MTTPKSKRTVWSDDELKFLKERVFSVGDEVVEKFLKHFPNTNRTYGAVHGKLLQVRAAADVKAHPKAGWMFVGANAPATQRCDALIKNARVFFNEIIRSKGGVAVVHICPGITTRDNASGTEVIKRDLLSGLQKLNVIQLDGNGKQRLAVLRDFSELRRLSSMSDYALVRAICGPAWKRYWAGRDMPPPLKRRRVPKELHDQNPPPTTAIVVAQPAQPALVAPPPASTQSKVDFRKARPPIISASVENVLNVMAKAFTSVALKQATKEEAFDQMYGAVYGTTA